MCIELRIDRWELPSDMDGNLDHGPDLARVIQKLIQREVDAIGDALAGDPPDIRDSRGAITIDDVKHEDQNEYSMCFSVDWHTYMGCKDMDYDSEEELATSFTIVEDGTVTFVPQPPRRRSTADEL